MIHGFYCRARTEFPSPYEYVTWLSISSSLYHLFLPLQTCRLTKAEGRTDRQTGVCAAIILFSGASHLCAHGPKLPSGQSAQEQAWILPLTSPASEKRAGEWCLTLTHCACRFTLPQLDAKDMVHHRSGHQTAQGISDGTGLALVLHETHQQPHVPQELLKAFSLFLNGLVQFRYARKSNSGKSLLSGLERLLHVSSLVCEKAKWDGTSKEIWFIILWIVGRLTQQ